MEYDYRKLLDDNANLRERDRKWCELWAEVAEKDLLIAFLEAENKRLKRLVDLAVECTKLAQRYIGDQYLV